MKISHWDPVFKRVSDNDAPVMAGGILVKMKQILNYALRRNRISKNVLMTLSVPDVGEAPKARKRNFDDNEIGLYWQSVDRTRMAQQNKLFMKHSHERGERLACAGRDRAILICQQRPPGFKLLHVFKHHDTWPGGQRPAQDNPPPPAQSVA